MELKKYIRDKRDRQVVDSYFDEKGCECVRYSRGRIIGTIVSNGKNSVGWSIVHPDDDVDFIPYDKKYGLELARQVEKFITIDHKYIRVPPSIRKEVEQMLERSEKYFQEVPCG